MYDPEGHDRPAPILPTVAPTAPPEETRRHVPAPGIVVRVERPLSPASIHRGKVGTIRTVVPEDEGRLPGPRGPLLWVVFSDGSMAPFWRDELRPSFAPEDIAAARLVPRPWIALERPQRAKKARGYSADDSESGRNAPLRGKPGGMGRKSSRARRVLVGQMEMDYMHAGSESD